MRNGWLRLAAVAALVFALSAASLARALLSAAPPDGAVAQLDSPDSDGQEQAVLPRVPDVASACAVQSVSSEPARLNGRVVAADIFRPPS